MKNPIEKSYAILIALVSAWVASVTLILLPTVGLTTPVFPPKPVESYKIGLLLMTTVFASIYSMRLGIQNIFPEGLKIRRRWKSLKEKKESAHALS